VRQQIVAQHRKGLSARRIARDFRVSLSTVQFWVRRAGRTSLSLIDWADRSSRPKRNPAQTTRTVQRAICRVRRQLAKDDLGFAGAVSVQAALKTLLPGASPSVRTIHRILHAQGFMDGQRRRRHPAPPPGWYLPTGDTELDSFDFIEGLGLGEAGSFDVFTGRALRGTSRLASIAPHWSSLTVADALVRHWRSEGLPAYAQFDNDLRFHGTRHPPGSIGRIIRLCLSLGVTPVFAPPRESGFQAAIEHFNGLWQRQVWHRFDFVSLSQLRTCSERFVHAYIRHLGQRGQADRTLRRPFPPRWRPDYSTIPTGKIIFLRRTNASGTVDVLSHRRRVDAHWPHRLLRCTLSLPDQRLHCHRLRRRDPSSHPFVATCFLPCCLTPIRRGRAD
jgi:putative transposase